MYFYLFPRRMLQTLQLVLQECCLVASESTHYSWWSLLIQFKEAFCILSLLSLTCSVRICLLWYFRSLFWMYCSLLSSMHAIGDLACTFFHTLCLFLITFLCCLMYLLNLCVPLVYQSDLMIFFGATASSIFCNLLHWIDHLPNIAWHPFLAIGGMKIAIRFSVVSCRQVTDYYWLILSSFDFLGWCPLWPCSGHIYMYVFCNLLLKCQIFPLWWWDLGCCLSGALGWSHAGLGPIPALYHWR